jgi:hypothetical protein
MIAFALGGPERIRTAVEAFAELCLATRPQDLLFTNLKQNLRLLAFMSQFRIAKVQDSCQSAKVFSKKSQVFSKQVLRFRY